MYESILIATDGSEGAERAEDVGVRLAERDESQVHAIHVVDTRVHSEPALSSIELETDAMEDEGLALLDDILAECEACGLDCEIRCSHGKPHEEVIEYADHVDADLLVMGYQGQSHERQMGSTVERVMRQTDRPVMAV
jgi:nucleotide-binding universal stress UspA family protein